MPEYTKRERIMKYTETVYYVDGDEVEAVRHYDDWTYDQGVEKQMTQEERESYE